MDNTRKKLRLGDVLVNSGVISEEQLQRGLELQKGSGRKLGETLVDEGFVTEENITNACRTWRFRKIFFLLFRQIF